MTGLWVLHKGKSCDMHVSVGIMSSPESYTGHIIFTFVCDMLYIKGGSAKI